MKFIRQALVAAAVGGAVLSAGIGLAGPASAEPLNGSYTVTVVDGGGMIKNGVTQIWMMTPCGPDCVHLHQDPAEEGRNPIDIDLHQQGSILTGSAFDGARTVSVDTNTLVDNELFTSKSGNTHSFVYQLSKNV